MQTSVLKMEVRHKQKHVATILRHADEEALVIGHTKKADLRLFNPEVSAVHAAVHHDGQAWWIRDLGSVTGTWVNKKAVTEYSLEGGSQIRIGQHDIYITTTERDISLFPAKKPMPQTGKVFHQVVVKSKNKIYRSYLFASNEKFIWQGKEFLPPTNEALISQEFSGYTIEQRLVHVQSDLEKSKEKNDGLTRETLIATGSVGFLFALFLVFSIFSFSKPGMDITLPEAKTAKFVPLKMKSENSSAATREIINEMAAASAPKAPNQASSAKTIASSFSAVMGRVTQRLAKANINLQKSGVAGAAVGTSSASMGIKGTGENVSGLVGKIGSTGGTGVQVMGGNGIAGIGQLQQGSLGTGQVAAQEEESEVLGGLDKEVIAKIIRSYLGQIRYCYERQLSATPDLYGKLLVHFSIGQAGSVNTQSILSSSLQNKNVEGCVLKQVAAWKFPQPKGGTIVKVSYPFLFTSTK